ncbi:hypothetical protein AYI70_g3579 [Smittium culicis]|uniref:Zn(2)-C6 fungal-type domain-containing protein n=1 Tax=Smittium culicis TaxID=133412 RepID=A0A1R1Y2S0_9FUNG|nr:hypothetical protein AYI70_g3579 [Smittium culicis]
MSKKKINQNFIFYQEIPNSYFLKPYRMNDNVENDKKVYSSLPSTLFKMVRHRRTYHSCKFCRLKKIKCNGGRPVCNNCELSDRFCSYEEMDKDNDSIDYDKIVKKLKLINRPLKRILSSKKIDINPDCIKFDDFSPKNVLNSLLSISNEIGSLSTQNYIVSPQKNTISDQKNQFQSIVSNLALELGYLDVDDALLVHLIDKVFVKSIFSLALSKAGIISRINSKSLPEFMKYSLLSYLVKFTENHIIFKKHLYVLGSSYAEKALSLINASPKNITVDKILSLVLLSCHHVALSKTDHALALLNLATKYSFILKLNVMDLKKKRSSLIVESWIEKEYSRRVWWLVYSMNICHSYNFGAINPIQNNNIFVNLPSNDEQYQNFNGNVLENNVPESSCQSNFDRNSYGDFNFLIKAYIELGAVGSFINMNASRSTSKGFDYLKKFEVCKNRLEKYEEIYKANFDEVKIRNELHSQEDQSKEYLSEKENIRTKSLNTIMENSHRTFDNLQQFLDKIGSVKSDSFQITEASSNYYSDISPSKKRKLSEKFKNTSPLSPIEIEETSFFKKSPLSKFPKTKAENYSIYKNKLTDSDHFFDRNVSINFKDFSKPPHIGGLLNSVYVPNKEMSKNSVSFLLTNNTC